MYNSQNTADIIKKILFDKKCSVKKMCLDCNFSINTLSNIRRGDVKSIETFYNIAEYLDCSVDYLLGRTDIQHTSAVSELSPQEEKLLDAFRSSDDLGKLKIIQFVMNELDKSTPK